MSLNHEGTIDGKNSVDGFKSQGKLLTEKTPKTSLNCKGNYKW